MPDRFIPIQTNTSLDLALNQINRNFASLDHENTVKTFKQPGGNSSIQGRLPYEGGYGSLYYDADNVARGIIGIDPDGEFNIHVSKEGNDVIGLF
jgi:hypothetical protein